MLGQREDPLPQGEAIRALPSSPLLSSSFCWRVPLPRGLTARGAVFPHAACASPSRSRTCRHWPYPQWKGSAPTQTQWKEFSWGSTIFIWAFPLGSLSTTPPASCHRKWSPPPRSKYPKSRWVFPQRWRGVFLVPHHRHYRWLMAFLLCARCRQGWG